MRTFALLAAAGLAAPALAAPFSAYGPYNGGSSGANPAANEYQRDDGTAENAIGLTQGGSFAWANQFNVTAGNEVLTAIRVAFGTPLSINGLAVTAFLWDDPNQDGNPTDAVVLRSVAGTISGASASTPIGSPTFISFDIADIALPVGRSFFIGALVTQGAGQFPAAVDQSNAPHPPNRTWAGFTATGTPFNPNAWSNVTDISTIAGLAGRWLVRGDASPIPAPGAVALLGLGGLLAGRRRR